MAQRFRALAVLAETIAQVPAPTLASSQLPATSAPEDLTPLASEGTYTRVHKPIHKHR